ncbi:MAG: hypothetical protein GKR77_07225 [Legionellales bacterium]|nr:hypothetical protein [Legionellales bacterium]
MKKTILAFFLSLSVVNIAIAQSEASSTFPCYLQFNKGSCWQGYQVDLQIIDEISGEVITSIRLSKEEFQQQQSFPCRPEQELRFKATFSPAIWEKGQDQWYDAKRVVFVPSMSMAEGKKAWLLKRCFHHDFLSVPLPTQGDVGRCACE